MATVKITLVDSCNRQINSCSHSFSFNDFDGSLDCNQTFIKNLNRQKYCHVDLFSGRYMLDYYDERYQSITNEKIFSIYVDIIKKLCEVDDIAVVDNINILPLDFYQYSIFSSLYSKRCIIPGLSQCSADKIELLEKLKR